MEKEKELLHQLEEATTRIRALEGEVAKLKASLQDALLHEKDLVHQLEDANTRISEMQGQLNTMQSELIKLTDGLQTALLQEKELLTLEVSTKLLWKLLASLRSCIGQHQVKGATSERRQRQVKGGFCE